MRMRNMSSPTDGDLPPEGNSASVMTSDYANEFSHRFRARAAPTPAGHGSHPHGDSARVTGSDGRPLVHRCPFSNCCHTVTTHTYVPPSLPPTTHAHHYPSTRPHSPNSATAPLTTNASTCYRLRSPLESRPGQRAALSKEDIKIAASRLLAQGFPPEALWPSHQQHTQCQGDIREAAVECMLAELSLHAKTNPSIITRLKHLENQVFAEAKTVQEYFLMIATKLADVFNELQKARTIRSAHGGQAHQPTAPHGGALARPPSKERPPSPPEAAELLDACSPVLRQHSDSIPPTLT